MLDKDMITIIKDIASVISCATGAIALLTIICKPLRKRVVDFVSQNAHTEEIESTSKALSNKFDELSNKMTEQLSAIREENKEQTGRLDLCIDGSRASLGNSIKHIYYKYLNSEVQPPRLPPHEVEAIVTLHAAYKALGGNHYVDKIFEEMMDKWNHEA